MLNQAEVIISKEGIKITKIKEQNDETNVMNIQIDACDEKRIDVGDKVDKKTREEVITIMDEYTPKKIKTTNIEMKIILNDETPVYQTTRRLPFTEREIVDKQNEQWVKDSIVEPCSFEYAS